MIPTILHQTWKTDSVPARFQAYIESWKRHHPGWTMMFWNDRMLLEFVAEHHPDFLPVFCSYSHGVLRADAARYLLLYHFGGVYADIDCECVAPFDPIMSENRIVLCREPTRTRWYRQSFEGCPICCSMERWPVRPGIPSGCRSCRCCRDWSTPGRARRDRPLPADVRAACLTLSIHHWAGTWWTPQPAPRWREKLRNHAYRFWHHLTRGAHLDDAATKASVSRAAVSAPRPPGSNIAILVSLRDAADHIQPFLDALQALDYPRSSWPSAKATVPTGAGNDCRRQ
jgi:hypothetical protein